MRVTTLLDKLIGSSVCKGWGLGFSLPADKARLLVDHLRGRVVWAGKERNAKTCCGFSASSDHKKRRSSKG